MVQQCPMALSIGNIALYTCVSILSYVLHSTAMSMVLSICNIYNYIYLCVHPILCVPYDTAMSHGIVHDTPAVTTHTCVSILSLVPWYSNVPWHCPLVIYLYIPVCPSYPMCTMVQQCPMVLSMIPLL